MKTNNDIFDQKYVRTLLTANIYYDIVWIKQVIYLLLILIAGYNKLECVYYTWKFVTRRDDVAKII